MHAARAIKKQREKLEDKVKLDVRRPSAISQSRINIPRSPATSVDTNARRSQIQNDESDGLNFSYIGFIIAVFGAVPLIVGTFVEVPALWEIGLGVTLVGLFIGVVFWCTELCAEAKKFSQKKNQLSTRGKIEDSNLLQVPERKFGNGMDSRRNSFQSDSVSLISPAVQHYTPKNHSNHPHLAHNPASLLRGSGRRDEGRVVSLVQPDPGLDDDSDSDAETVIEAPTSHPTKLIQVQSCQEKQQQHHHHFQQHSHLTKPLLGTMFNMENERISPLSQQHRTIRMPVMPQEVEKLQRCECGRYLLTERDKLIGIKLPGISGSSSGSTTTSSSPIPFSSLPVQGTGNVPVAPRSKALRGNLDLNLGESIYDSTNVAGGTDAKTPLADQPPPPPPNKIISVNPSVKIAPTVPPTPQNTAISDVTDVVENTVQVDPTLSSSSTAKDFLRVTSAARKKTENMNMDFDDDDDDDDDGDVTPGNESGKTFQDAVATVVAGEEEEDKIITELLELTDVNDEEIQEQQVEPSAELTTATSDENHNREQEQIKDSLLSREGSRRRFQYQSQITSINRPTSLPLPASITDEEVTDSSTNNNIKLIAESKKNKSNKDTSKQSSIITVEHATTGNDDQSMRQQQQQQPGRIQSGKLRENNPNLTDDMSLDELLDTIEKNQEGEVLAVVVQ